MRIGRCSLCNRTNADANVITKGPLAATPHLMWHRGTSTNPQGGVHRLCFIVFTHGGFADEFGDLDIYVDKRRADSASGGTMMVEWQASWDALVQMGSDLPLRFGAVVAKGRGEKLLVVRRQRVETYKKSQRVIKATYKLILRSKYEKQFPGKIERKSLPTKWVQAEGQNVEVVMLRKLPQGEWDCDFEELQGASHVEDYDSGQLNSRAGQAKSKFKRARRQGLAFQVRAGEGHRSRGV